MPNNVQDVTMTTIVMVRVKIAMLHLHSLLVVVIALTGSANSDDWDNQAYLEPEWDERDKRDEHYGPEDYYQLYDMGDGTWTFEGGEPAKVGEFKSVVYINVTHSYTEKGILYNGPASSCTGTIVSPKWVLTAAHCLPIPYLYTYCFPKQDGRYSHVNVKITVTAGSVDLFNNNHVKAVTLSPSYIRVHEDAVTFEHSDPKLVRYLYDVTLLKMAEEFPDNDVIGAVALMTGPLPDVFPFECIALGFGKQIEGNSSLDKTGFDGKLRYALLKAGSNVYCSNVTMVEKWANKPYLCTHNIVDKERQRVSCAAQNGSPLLCGSREVHVVAGIMSSSIGRRNCGVITLFTFTGWIKEWVKNKTDDEAFFKELSTILKSRGFRARFRLPGNSQSSKTQVMHWMVVCSTLLHIFTLS